MDQVLVERGFAESRNKAQAMILAGQVRLKVAASQIKPGTLVRDETEISVTALPKYVSRGGDKLESAMVRWSVDVKDAICLDVGSSTGGFTDCLLQRGAKKVYAVDVGRGQMHPKMRNDPRVALFEKTHILNWTPPYKETDADAPSMAVMDVSFISIQKVLPTVLQLLPGKKGVMIFALFKPQFEVGPKLMKKGIVRDDAVRETAIQDFIDFCKSIHLEVADHFACPVLGMKGNREEWFRLEKGISL